MNEVNTQATGDTIQKIECYVTNVSEFLQEFEIKFIEQDGNVVKVDFATAVEMLQSLWDKVKETSLECEGKTIEVELPDGLTGTIIELLLAVIKFRL